MTSLPAVVSKNLFNYEPMGKLDDEIVELEKKAMEKLFASGFITKMGPVMARASDGDNSACVEIATEFIRPMCAQHANEIKAKGNAFKALKGAVDCAQSEITVPIRDGNDAPVTVYIHRPSNLEGNDNAAYIYAHGGGAVAMEAADYSWLLNSIACDVGVVGFNVEYRLAPETRAPNNALDFYCALKHIIENAVQFGVDPNKIVISGDSGGAYVAMAAMVMLSRRNEGGMVKLAMLGVPMIDDDSFLVPLEEMSDEARQSVPIQQAMWKCIAPDFKIDHSDALLFPLNASDEEYAGMPPTIIVEKEFDVFLPGATRAANRLREAGRLLEFIVYPGLKHGSEVLVEPNSRIIKRWFDDIKLIFKEYVF